MGRAIDMENSISTLKTQIKKLEDTVRGMVSKIDEIDAKSSKTKHINLIEDVGADVDEKTTETKEKDVEKKESNNEGSGDSNRKDNTKSTSTKSKGSKSRTTK